MDVIDVNVHHSSLMDVVTIGRGGRGMSTKSRAANEPNINRPRLDSFEFNSCI